MTQLEKARAAVEDLVARGVWRSTAAPLFYRALWRLGVAAPPPLFQSSLGLTGIFGAPFGLIVAVVFGPALFFRTSDSARPVDILILVTGAGTLVGLQFGTVVATYFRWYARRLGLPKWDDYTPGELAEKEPDW